MGLDRDTETELLARVYALILSWPCPTCGEVGFCACGENTSQTAENTVGDDQAINIAAESSRFEVGSVRHSCSAG